VLIDCICSVSFVSAEEGHNRFANGLLALIVGLQNKGSWIFPYSQYVDKFLLTHLDLAGRKLETVRLVWRLPWLMNAVARQGCDRLKVDLSERRAQKYTEECLLHCSSSDPVIRTTNQSPVSSVRLLAQLIKLSGPALKAIDGDSLSASRRLPLQVVGRMRSYVQQFEQAESASTASALVQDSLDWLTSEADIKLIPKRFELTSVGGSVERIIPVASVSVRANYHRTCR
jgi:hypothetical protein